MSSKKRNLTPPLTVCCEYVDINKLFFTPMDYHNTRSAGQGISYANYDYLPNVTKHFVFKTKPIKFTLYGIPHKNEKNEKTSKYIKSDNDREYFRIPFDQSQENSVALFEMLKKIDDNIDKWKPTIFGDKADEYVYSKLVKDPNEIEENEEINYYNKKNKNGTIPRFQFCKVKLDTDYNDNRRITTTVFNNFDDNPKIVENIRTVSDVAEHLTWQSSARFVIMVNKLWAEKDDSRTINTNSKPKLKEFGITLKCLQMEITEKAPKTESVKNIFKNIYGFDESLDYDPNKYQEIDEDTHESNNTNDTNDMNDSTTDTNDTNDTNDINDVDDLDNINNC